MMSFLVLSMGCGGPGARTVPCSNGSMAQWIAPIAHSITSRASAGLLLFPNDFCVSSCNAATHLPIADSELVLTDCVAEWSSCSRLQPTVGSSTPVPSFHRSIVPSFLRSCVPRSLGCGGCRFCCSLSFLRELIHRFWKCCAAPECH